MSDVDKTVNTTFTVKDHASGAMKSLTTVAQRTGQALSGVFTPFRALIAGAGIAMAVRGIAEMQSHAEGTRLAIAGTLNAFKMVDNMTDGFRAAQSVIDQINHDAAILPGSAEDYVEVFRTALPAALSSGMTDLHTIAAMSNQAAAVAISNQIDSAQAARDTALILRGHAGQHVRLWTTLAPLVAQVARDQGKIVSSGQEWNKLTNPQRVALFQGALARYAPMLAAGANTWDAIYGTTKQVVVQMARMMTMPLFDGMKRALSKVNGLLMDQEGHLTSTGEHIVAIGRNMAFYIVDKAKAIYGWFVLHQAAIARTGRILHEQFVVALGQAEILVKKIGDHIGKFDIRKIEQLAGMAMLMKGGGASAVGGILNFAGSLGSGAAGSAGTAASGGSAAAASLPAVAIAAGILGPVLISLADGSVSLRGTFAQLITATAPAVTAFINLWHAVRPIIDVLGGALIGNFTRVVQVLAYVIAALLYIPTKIFEAVSWVLNQIPGLPDALRRGIGPAEAMLAIAAMPETHIQSKIQESGIGNKAVARARPGTADLNQRGGGNFDFRNSRFNITQKFMEGFDPDRIAVAFSHDIERLGNNRLQGSFEPIFGIH